MKAPPNPALQLQKGFAAERQVVSRIGGRTVGMPDTTTAQLREVLLSIPRASSADEAQQMTRILRQALLEFGSETDDNVAAVDKIAVGRLEQSTGRDGWGLRLASSALPLSTIINSAEGSPVPEQVRAAHPGLTQEEWDAVLRVVSLAFLSFEGGSTG